MIESLGGIILCGGRSLRMGAAKASLPFGPETMLARVVRILGEVCRPIVVVAAVDQTLPPLPADVRVTRDRFAGRGPLEGLAVGLAALENDVPLAFATACDAPLLVGAMVRRMAQLIGDDAAAVPVTHGLTHPLAAVYRTSLIELIEQLLTENRRRPMDLFDIVSTRRVEARELVNVNPRLDSLRNLNTPEEYQAALAAAGLTKE